MQIIHKKPLFFPIIKIFFQSADFDGGTIFTFGNKIYTKNILSESLMAHEETHVKQQVYPMWWWIKYIISKRFRFDQELEAHINEYRATVGSRNERDIKLRQIAQRLCSSLYGNIVSFDEAYKLIKKGNE